MTDIVVTPPAVISITATSPNAYTITATQPASVTVTAAVGNVGDMTKAVYDTNLNGVVDNSEALGGVAASGFVQTGNASWVDLTDGGATTLHTHTGSAVTSIATTAPITGGTITSTGTIGIDAATTLVAGSMSASDKTKLDGIASGAQVNNISDVNATDLTDGGSTSLHSHANDHARQHSITSTSDHTSTATSGQMLKADANGLPVNATNTDAQVSAAVTASHAAVTVADTTSIDMTLTGQQVSAAAIFGTGAGVVAEGNHTHSSPALVDPSVADNFVSFSDTTGAQKDSGKGLTHLVYTLQTSGVAAANPSDGGTIYYGCENTGGATANVRGVYFPFAGTIVYASVVILVNTVLGDATTFSCYIRVNNTTDVLITDAAQATAARQQYSNTGLSQAVAVNDYFEGKVVFPTWRQLTRQVVKDIL